MRELRPPARPLRTGLLCLVAALTLALAAGTLGIGPGPAPAGQFWRAGSFEARGGVIGPGGAVGQLAPALDARRGHSGGLPVLAGLILVTGATLAGVVRATGAGVLGTGRAVRRSTDSLSATLARRPATTAARSQRRDDGARRDRSALRPRPAAGAAAAPEPDTDELVVRATHVEAPPISGERSGLDEDPPSLAGPRGAAARRRGRGIRAAGARRGRCRRAGAAEVRSG